MNIRKCPICRIDIQYKTKTSLKRATINNTKCRSCNNKGENNPFFGKSHSKETLTSAKNKRISNPEWKSSCTNKTKKTGELNGMYQTSNYDIWLKKYGKDEADIRLKNFKSKISIKTSGENNPMYGKPSPSGSGNGWQGWYKNFRFRSLLELSFLINVAERFNFDIESAEIKKYQVKYINEEKTYNYYPDFVLNKKYVIEVKPKALHNSKIVMLKSNAAKKYFESIGLKFKIMDVKRLTPIQIKNLVDSKLIKFDKKYSIKYEKNQK